MYGRDAVVSIGTFMHFEFEWGSSLVFLGDFISILALLCCCYECSNVEHAKVGRIRIGEEQVGDRGLRMESWKISTATIPRSQSFGLTNARADCSYRSF